MTVTHRELDLGISLFLELIHADEALVPVLSEARAEYFPATGGLTGDPRGAPAAEVRFIEWLLFERDHQGGLLVDALLPAWRDMAGEDLAKKEDVFLGTSAGMYEVGGPAGEDLHWLRDISGLGEYAVQLRILDGTVQEGDLVVGRLFPRGDSTHTISPGAGCFRDEALLQAVHRDLDTARDKGTRKALRIRQVDLEQMFWGGSKSESSADPVGELRAFLTQGGLESDEIDGLIETLALRPVPENTTGPFFLSTVQDLLEHIAFETDVDLNQTQDLFLACWLHLHHSKGSQDSNSSQQELEQLEPRDALDAFDADRASGLDAETAIARLGARLGIDPGAEMDETARAGGSGVALLPGLLEEYLWECGQGDAESKETCRAALSPVLEGLADAEVVEDLSSRRLLLAACTNLVEAPSMKGSERADAAVELSRFSSWCAENHGMPVSPEASDALTSLPDSIIRVHEANALLEDPEPTGAWMPLARVGECMKAADEAGDLHPVKVSADALQHLRPGDFVRGVIEDDALRVRWCYPPELGAAR